MHYGNECLYKYSETRLRCVRHVIGCSVLTLPSRDLDDCSPQDAIWVLSYVITAPHRCWDALCAAQSGCGSRFPICPLCPETLWSNASFKSRLQISITL